MDEEDLTLEELTREREALGEDPPDPYDLLNVWVGCGRAHVRAQFEERSALYVPDRYEEEEERAIAEEIWEIWVVAREELLERETSEEAAEISGTPLLLGQGSFWAGVYGRAGVLGVAAMGLAAWWGGGRMVAAVAVGMLVMGANLGAIFGAVRWMLPAGEPPRAGAGGWAGLFLLKLLVLFWLTYYVVLVLRMSAIGFLGGYLVFMAALTWNVVKASGHLGSSPRDEEDEEGS